MRRTILLSQVLLNVVTSYGAGFYMACLANRLANLANRLANRKPEPRYLGRKPAVGDPR